jgi:LPXTG-motif cell wall-anchored protein
LDPETGEWVFEEYPPPLANLELPQTGDLILIALLMMLLSGLAMIVLSRRKARSAGASGEK